MSSTKSITEKEVQALIQGKLSRYFGVSPKEATIDQIYKAVVMSVRDILLEKRQQFHRVMKSKRGKRVYYLCMEFLLGRSLKNNIYNLGLGDAYSKALKYFNLTLEDLYEQEPDAGLGNGGLGRLAACFMDALATGNYPAMGYSLRYEYGLFRQKLVDGWQTELPDTWLPGGGIWLQRVPESSVEVRFGGHIEEQWHDQYHSVRHKDYTSITAIPYDMCIAGMDGKGISLLRVWKAENDKFDMKLFNGGNYMRAMEQQAMSEIITKVLYPEDNHTDGKLLRLSQQYFLVSASIQDIIRRHLYAHGNLDKLPELAAIHLNDTHPVLAIPEMMRVMLDECGYGWDAAWDIVKRTVAYTNHTVMSEALETWNRDLFKMRLPRIYQIVEEIDRRFWNEMRAKGVDEAKIYRMAPLNDGYVKMANLAVIGSHCVNGVSALHSEILKDDVFHDFYVEEPSKFTNVTNGIAYRRWLYQSNPGLCSLLNDTIGDSYLDNAMNLKKLESFAQDESVLTRLAEVKSKNKKNLSKYLKQRRGIEIDPDTIFDVQVKRLHEYKRQHLNVLNIVSEYDRLVHNPDADVTPKTYIFGAKAAPSYYMAKEIIKLIWSIGEEIKKNPRIKEKLNVVFLENYNVSLTEILMPASEISEQISLAGTEASGTGNMKFMLSGAVTLGTRDGANVEIGQVVGQDNIINFGMTVDEVERLKREGYHPGRLYSSNPVIKSVVDRIAAGFNGNKFDNVVSSLKNIDPYMVLADFGSYQEAQARASALYSDTMRWQRMSLINIANAGIFSADRAVDEYAKNIWGL